MLDKVFKEDTRFLAWAGRAEVVRKEKTALLLVPSNWPWCSAEHKQFHTSSFCEYEGAR